MTTEDRIAQIAQGFGQGLQNFQAGQRQLKAEELRAEALRRQQALDSQELAQNLSGQTGRAITAEQVQPFLASGDFSGLDQILSSAPLSRKAQADTLEAQRQQQKFDLDQRKTLAEISRLQRLGMPGAQGASYKEQLQVKKLERDLAKQSDPVQQLGVEGKKMVGIANEGINAITGMQQAVSSGVGPSYIDSNTPILGAVIGDTPFTANQRIAAEMFGRLQSGGAINKQEEERFIAMGPRPSDSKELAAQKLEAQKAAIQDRLNILGATPEVLARMGIAQRPSVPSQGPQALQVPSMVNEAQAADPEYLEYQMLLQKAGR